MLFVAGTRSRLSVVYLSVVLASGCASYRAGPMPIPNFQEMPVRQIENGVAIGLDPIWERERRKNFFGDDLLGQAVLPIHIFVQNQGHTPIHASASASLVLADGTEIFQGLPISPPGVPPQRSQFCENALVFGGVMPGPGLLVNFGCVVFGAASGAKYQTELERWKDYVSKQLKSTVLEHNQSAHGFLFFPIPAETHHNKDATLLLKITKGEPPDGAEQTRRLYLTMQLP